MMASFSIASVGLRGPIAMQLVAAEHRDADAESRFAVCGSFNAGETFAAAALLGESIDLVARIRDNARPSQILASSVIRQLATGKNAAFTILGDADLRGFDDSVQLWELGWND